MLAVCKAFAVHFETASLRTLASFMRLLLSWGASLAVDLIAGIGDE